MIPRVVSFLLFYFSALFAAELAVVDAYFEDYDRMLVRQQLLPAGDTVFLTFRVAGFRANEKRQVRLSYWIDCLDPQNVPLVETYSTTIEETLSPQDERWRPKVNWSVVVPSYAPSGQYRVQIKVRDEIAGQETRHQMSFGVKGLEVEPSPTLAVRNFEFADSEDGKPKESATYPRSSTLWARFRLVGFKVGPDKQIDLEQDLSVLDSDGKVVFSKPQAAVEKHRMFYPPRFLTESFNLELQQNVRPGQYTIRLDIRDLLGQQTSRYETRFTVLP